MKLRSIAIAGFLFALSSSARAEQRTRLPFTAYDGGYLSAEALGRGNAAASGVSSLGGGSASPAGLSGKTESSVYATTLVGLSTNRPQSAIVNLDPTDQRTLQNLAVGSSQGVLFYEPLGRMDGTDTALLNGLNANRDVHFAADALGFAATDKWRDGSVGLSIAYLYGSLGEVLTSTASTLSQTDRGYGLRMNLALRKPTGPFMWGLQLQNVPGFLWWNHHRRDQLPVIVRIGNTWRISPGVLFSVDTEKRFYNEGGLEKNYVYIGSENSVSDNFTLRLGLFSEDIGRPEKRHYTGGFSWKLSSDVDITYALDRYEDLNESVKQSVLSIRIPMAMDSGS